jgi:hypothetical protein
MVWIVALLAAWLAAGLLVAGLVGAASRGDQLTPEHVRRLARSRVWLPPRVDD